ncbi:DUF3501 family protein [Candidatus Sumerlaeota bacterium]|nr:DUF3501 family protein [Candidatus Sumerlaeota bacterium]
MRTPACMIFALGSLLLGGCAEVQVLRDRVDLLEQNNARLRDEFQKSEDKYYVINAQRLSDSEALNGRIRLLELELDEARNVRSDRERGLEDERFKLSLELDGETIRALAEADVDRTSAAGKASSIQFLHFPFTDDQARKFAVSGARVGLAIGHPKYAHMTVLPEAVRQALAEDFD